MRRLTIAIDGPAGSGKSSVARVVAQRLGYLYLDSGAMYRALALKALQNNGIALTSEKELEQLARDTQIELQPVPATLRDPTLRTLPTLGTTSSRLIPGWLVTKGSPQVT